MNEHAEELLRQATLKQKVWLATKTNFIKFTTRRCEAAGRSQETGESLQMHRKKLPEWIFLDIQKKCSDAP